MRAYKKMEMRKTIKWTAGKEEIAKRGKKNNKIVREMDTGR